MAENTCKISFEVSGYIVQTVEVVKPGLTPAEMVKGLKSGVYATTVQEGGTVDVIADGEVVGRVVNVDNQLEYTEYELDTPEDTW